jgi:hypothetical protein
MTTLPEFSASTYVWYLVVYSGGPVVANFTPTLSACVVTGDWESGKIVSEHIRSKLNWHLDLSSMPTHTNWRLEESGAGYTLEID